MSGSQGRLRKWDLVEAHDSIAVLLYHTGMSAVLLVRQFRPAVYAVELGHASRDGKPPPSFEAGEFTKVVLYL